MATVQHHIYISSVATMYTYPGLRVNKPLIGETLSIGGHMCTCYFLSKSYRLLIWLLRAIVLYMTIYLLVYLFVKSLFVCLFACLFTFEKSICLNFIKQCVLYD